MRTARLTVGALFVFVLVLKLFTFEYSLRDDATSGLGTRAVPALTNYKVLQHSPPRSSILLEDENDFPGAGLYRAATGWGLLALLVAWLSLVIMARWQVRLKLATP